MKRITIYGHQCKRCDREFTSKSPTPRRCGKCKSPYWHIERRQQQKAA